MDSFQAARVGGWGMVDGRPYTRRGGQPLERAALESAGRRPAARSGAQGDISQG